MTNLLYIGRDKNFLSRFGKMEGIQMFYAENQKEAVTICTHLKAREDIIILYEQGKP